MRMIDVDVDIEHFDIFQIVICVIFVQTTNKNENSLVIFFSFQTKTEQTLHVI